MTTLVSQPLPEYEKPPVEEVVCGVLFEPIRDFQLPHFGLLWEKFRKEYPRFQEVAPLAPVIERFEETPSTEIEPPELPLPRLWFLHDEGRIIQVQRDRFLHNWRKQQPTDEYPRYDLVFQMFRNHLSIFLGFLDEFQLGPFVPRQYEMTYVNVIPQGEGWETADDVNKFFPDFAWRSRKGRFLPDPIGINWRMTFPLPDQAGRLHMNIQSGRRFPDKHRILRFEITARGIGADTSPEARQGWFDMAHEWIVRGFADYTGIQVQQNIWGRKE